MNPTTMADVASKVVDHAASAIDKLAVKLGVAASNVWNVLVMQGRMELAKNVGEVALGVGFAVLAAGLWQRSNNLDKDEDPDTWIGHLFGVTVCGIASLGCVCDGVSNMRVPEMWALEQLLKVVGK